MDESNIDETLVWFGGEVKALGEGKVGGYLVRFSGPEDPDLVGDYFTPETDFGEAKTTRILYQHGFDPVLKSRKLGVGDLLDDEIGVWVAAQLNLRDEYEKQIYELAEAGKLGWSSGTASHLVGREQTGKAWKITSWPLGLDASLTPTPAEPRNSAVPLKSLIAPQADAAEDRETVEPESEATGEQIETAPAEVRTIPTSEENMSDEVKTEVQDTPQADPMEARIKAMEANLNRILEHVENSPTLERGGYYTNDGGKKDPGHKSFGDFLLAIKRKDARRLASVYGSYKAREDEVKDLNEGTGAAGGYLVPTEYMDTLLEISAEASRITSLVTQVPVDSVSGEWPALDYSVSPTAGSGQSALAAGLSAAVTAEGAALTEDEPDFKQIQWRLNKVGGYTQVTNELNADSPQAIEVLLTRLFGVTVANVNERNIIRGNGAGEPLGILNAACAVAVTPSTNNAFSQTDALTMLSRFKRLTSTRPVWIIHPGVLPDFEFFTGSGASPDLVNWAGGVSPGLLGYPIITSEHMPQDDGDDVILADLGAYLWFQKGGLSIAFSEHVGFLNDLGTWRFTQRVDGQPWLSAAITLADPTGSFTVSPFVYHDD